MKITTAMANSIATTIIDDYLAAKTEAEIYLDLYTGTAPALGDPNLGTKLTHVLGEGWNASALNGKLIFGPFDQTALGLANGTAGYGVISDEDGIDLIQLTVGTGGSGADLILDDLDIIAGAPVIVSSLEISFGDA